MDESTAQTMDQQAHQILDTVLTLLATYGLDVVAAIAILVAGFILSRWAKIWVERALRRTEKVDSMLRGFFSSLVKYFVLVVTVLAVLSQFGVQTASLVAVFGAASLAIGLALQGTLTNLAAGVMLLIFRPFKVDDYVTVGGQSGTVKSLTLFLTELATPDNVQILLPNASVWGSTVTNYSFHSTRRLDLVVGIDYGDDIGKAKAALEDLAAHEGRILADPAPMVVVNGLGTDSVDMLLRVWCGAGDYWPLKFDMTRTIKERFDADGITIPFPQRVMHTIHSDA